MINFTARYRGIQSPSSAMDEKGEPIVKRAIIAWELREDGSVKKWNTQTPIEHGDKDSDRIIKDFIELVGLKK